MKVINKVSTGSNIRMYRKRVGMTARELSEKIGKNPQSMGLYETGLLPNNCVELLCDISDALNIPFNAIVVYYPERDIEKHPCAYSRPNTSGCLICLARTIPGMNYAMCRHIREAEKCSLFMPGPTVTYETRREDW